MPQYVACREIRRVLKPNGVAIFAEPVAFSRSFRTVKRGFRKALGPPTHVTETERQLSQADFRVLRKHFDRVQHTPFGFFTRLLRLDALKRFEPLSLAVDFHLLRLIPPLGRYCSYVTLTAREPRLLT